MNIKRYFSLALLPVMFILGGCDEVLNYFLVPTRILSPGMELGEQWQEIIPNPPLKVIKTIQKIKIEPPETLKWDFTDHPSTFKMPNGELFSIEVQVVSEHGKIYPLSGISFGCGIGFMHSFEGQDLTGNNTSLPKDIVYTKVRIRASRPIKSGKISWICYTNH